MLKDYRDILTGPMTDKQARAIAQILWTTLLEAKHTLVFAPQTIKCLEIMEAGMVMALYEKLRDVMSEEEYTEEIYRIIAEDSAPDRDL